MERDNHSIFERAVYALTDAWGRWRVPYLTALAAGLFAYMFAFTNKLVNHDDVMCLFSKGQTLGSGRWGLELMRLVFPDVSMPWLYGAVSLLLLGAAICFMLDLFAIRSRVIQTVLAAVIVTFPAQMDTFCYMFTSSSYAVALLLAVLAAWLFVRDFRGRWPVCIALLCFSMGIYQAYVALPAAFFVLLLIKRCMDGDKVSALIRDGVRFVAMLAASALLYYAVNAAVLRISGTAMNAYAENNLKVSVLHGLRVAYTAFAGLFYRGYFGYITPGLSLAAHCAALLFVGIEVVSAFLHMKNRGRRALFAALLVLFPLSIDCMYLISSTIHTLVLYGFISVYLFAGVIADGRTAPKRHFEKDVILLCLSAVAISNIWFSNTVFMKLYLQYENAMSFFTSAVTQIKQTEGFEPGVGVAFIGEADTAVFKPDSIDDHQLAGMYPTLINVYSRDDFVRYYVGFDVRYATEEEKARLTETGEYKEMPSYPYYGSVKRIEDFIVVKLG